MSIRMKSLSARVLFVAASVGIAVWGQAQAVAITWDGSGDMDWTHPDSTSWSGGTYSSGNNVQFDGLGTGTVNVDAGGVTPGDITVDTGSYIISGGPIGGSGKLTKNGWGTLTLSGTNTYSGLTTIVKGTLSVSSFDSLGSYSYFRLQSKDGIGTLEYTGPGESTSMQVLIGPSQNNKTMRIRNSGTGKLIFTNDFAKTPSTARASTLNLTGAGTGEIAGAIIDVTRTNNSTATLTLTKDGAGTWILSGANTYTGKNTINDGMLQFAKTASLYGGTTGSWTPANVRVNAGGTLGLNVGGTGEFSTGNVNTLLGNLGGLGGAPGDGQGLQAGSTVAFDTTNASGTFTIADNILDSTGTGGGTIGLTKLGAGTLELTGANTYTGATTVNDGTLLVNGSLHPSSAVTVNNGGTFGGTGTIGGPITVGGGGMMAPGASIGTLTGTDLTWNSDDLLAGMVFELSTTDNTSDLLDLSGTFAKGTGTDFLFDFTGGMAGQTYTLVNFADSTGFVVGNFVDNLGIGTSVGGGGEFALTDTNLQFTIRGTGGAVIPEPSTFLIWSLALIGLAWYARRRRTK